MLTDKSFRDEVWKKYEMYSQSETKEDFFDGNLYRRKKHISDIVKIAAAILIVTTTGVGIAYTPKIIYEKIFEKPTVINYQDEQQVTDEDKKSSITEDEAKEQAIKILESMGKTDSVNSIEFIKYPDEEISYWKVITNKQYEVKIDAKNGKLVSYYDGMVDDTKKSTVKDKSEVKKIAIELYQKIAESNDYELKDFQKVNITESSCLWQADFCKKYDGVYNDYQCVRITFIPETKEVKTINIFDEEFDNNPIVITKDEAIGLIKNRLQGAEIKSINCELKIEKMNPYMYMQENPLGKDEAYKMKRKVRKIWLVECVVKKNNVEQNEKYYVDTTTGEIIGGSGMN